ncbi:hypothetical protein KDN32_09485 [Nocardioides sp. J2M5]|uniref:hypothetical protein n=1 Tax=Nocardioides palaemonis TaxID=2829810 RepID=UPI001BAA015A|nr:hypothetical protein [Nocardioides palaemonis]MBS2937971.1 hypothetical protein [Nocardioides palaemonis]
MSALSKADPTPVAPTAPDTRLRVVGAAALALAASLVLQNAVVVSTSAPDYASPMADVLAFHTDHRTAVAVAVGLEALNLPLLLGFLAGLHGIVVRRGGAGSDWSRLALAAGAALSAALGLYAILWSGVVLAADGLAEPSPLLEVVWRMHAAAFGLALPALGTTFVAAALAARASGLVPAWHRVLAVAAGVLLVVAGSASLAIGDGSSLLFVGMPGYAAWIVWLVLVGVRLVRARRD